MHSLFDSSAIAVYLTLDKVDAYVRDIEAWFKKNDIPDNIGFADHFAIKVENLAAFHPLVDAIASYCTPRVGNTPGLSARNMQNRHIAVALLKEPLRYKSNLVDCIEIMQPKPKYEGTDVIGLDHLEFVVPDYDATLRMLDEKRVAYTIDNKNPYKRVVWANVNDARERVKFTDKTLAEIVPIQIKDAPELVHIIVDA